MGTISAHFSAADGVHYEHMFGTSQGTIDHQLERRREARRVEVRALSVQKARIDQRLTVLSREAGTDGDWKAAGCSSAAQWPAQISGSEYHTAAGLVDAGAALERLPALDAALSTGVLTLDQVTAAIPFATPATDAQLARVGVGMAPRAIARFARTLSPPTVADDAALRKRRALSLKWIEGGRELVINGRLPLEQGAAFEHAIRSTAEAQRAADKKTGAPLLAWQQSTADALLTLTTSSSDSNGNDTRNDGGNGGGNGDAGIKRSNATVILHLSADEPPFIEGAGSVSAETAEWIACDARRMTIKPHSRDLVHSRITRCASYPQLRAMVKRSRHCQYAACTSTYDLQAHHLLDEAKGGLTLTDEMILLCTRHHKLLHDHHIRTSGTGERPSFTAAGGRAITANQPHAPPR